MKKLIGLGLVLVALSGCNAGSTHLTPDYASGRHKFTEIDVKNTIKQGRECEITIPFLLIWSAPSGKTETSVMAIAKKYKIEHITYVDKHQEGFIPFFYQNCYTVYGY